ncbi:hypothetical protein ACFFRE_13345, partial [Aciditerrimonas ferrireducens]
MALAQPRAGAARDLGPSTEPTLAGLVGGQGQGLGEEPSGLGDAALGHQLGKGASQEAPPVQPLGGAALGVEGGPGLPEELGEPTDPRRGGLGQAVPEPGG